MIIVEDKGFWQGFDAAIEMVMNTLDQYESNELAKLCVFSFIEQFREDISEEVRLYKKEG